MAMEKRQTSRDGASTADDHDLSTQLLCVCVCVCVFPAGRLHANALSSLD